MSDAFRDFAFPAPRCPSPPPERTSSIRVRARSINPPGRRMLPYLPAHLPTVPNVSSTSAPSSLPNHYITRRELAGATWPRAPEQNDRATVEANATHSNRVAPSGTDSIVTESRSSLPYMRQEASPTIPPMDPRRRTTMSPADDDPSTEADSAPSATQEIFYSGHSTLPQRRTDLPRHASKLQAHCVYRSQSSSGASTLDWNSVPSPAGSKLSGKVQLIYSQAPPTVHPQSTGEDSESPTENRNKTPTPPSTGVALGGTANEPAAPDQVRLHEVATCLWRQLFATLQWDKAEDAPQFCVPPGQLIFILAGQAHVNKILEQHGRFMLRQFGPQGQVAHVWHYHDPVQRPHRPELISIGIAGIPYGFPARDLQEALPREWRQGFSINSIWELVAQYPEWNIVDGHTGLTVLVLEALRPEHIGSSSRRSHVAAQPSTLSASSTIPGSSADQPPMWCPSLERLVRELPEHRPALDYPHTWRPRFFCFDPAWEQEMSWFR